MLLYNLYSYRIFSKLLKCDYLKKAVNLDSKLYSQYSLSCLKRQSFSYYSHHTKNYNLSKRYSHRANNNSSNSKYQSTLYYVLSIGVLVVGLSYAAVPMYRIFCQAYSYAGTVKQDEVGDKVKDLIKRKDREIIVRFTADTAASMTWNFKPQQSMLKIIPGETALAFYTAENPMDKPIVGISTYNVVPFDAGQYFNKIQCFCFEEQILNPKEEVSMPVFFYIDPEFADDPKMENVNDIVLSYTFFESKDGMTLPLPGANRR